ncbi:hypothetical protein ABH916_003460 [Peribacillus frigoritolerans]|uniref:hypothetical protein n=1 Tax=Peribacillus frigoritolerans TaxID=450367 RepID=UPI0038343A02
MTVTKNQLKKAMTTQEIFEEFATQQQIEEYGVAYVHIYNMAKAVAKQEKKHIFQCSKKGKQDMARASMRQLQIITPIDPLHNIASAKLLDYIINLLKEKDSRVILLPQIITMMINEIIKYFNEMYKTTKDKNYLDYKEGAKVQKEMWKGMLELRHDEITR